VPRPELRGLHGHAEALVAQLEGLERLAPVGGFTLELTVLCLELRRPCLNEALQAQRPEQRRGCDDERARSDLGDPPQRSRDSIVGRDQLRCNRGGERENHGL